MISTMHEGLPQARRQGPRTGLGAGLGKGRWLTLVAAAALAACATTPEPVDPARLPAVPTAWRQAEPVGVPGWTDAAPAEPQARGSWWRVFHDPVLDALVERAGGLDGTEGGPALAATNSQLQIAAARLAQLEALARTRRADQQPQLGVAASAGRGTVAGAGPAASSLYQLGATLSYEADLAGRLSAASRAATLDAQAQAALVQSTRLYVQAQTAQAYLALRSVEAEQALLERTVAAYRETLRLTERRQAAGDVAELDLVRVQSQVAATEAEAQALAQQRALLAHALAVLVGEPASTFELAATPGPAALPRIPAGVPATLLTRRPDITAAQRSLMAAQERVGLARAAWFPSLELTASGGVASTALGDLLQTSARAWSLGALLALPIFDGGRRDAAVAGARAELDGAVASYREQVLGALREVEDPLAQLRTLAAQRDAQQRAVGAAARATQLSETRYRNGYVSQLDWLDAQRSELALRRQSLQVEAAQYQATVSLVRALGGGWGEVAER